MVEFLMKTYETFVYWDAKNHYAFYNSDPSSYADLKKIFLEHDVENFNRKPFVGIFEEIFRESFRK